MRDRWEGSARVSTLLGLLAASACGGGGSGGPSGNDAGGNDAGGNDTGGRDVTGGAPVDPQLAVFCQQVRESEVRFVQRCEGLPAEIAAQFRTVDPCVAWGPGVANGSLTFDGTQSQACIAALDASACDDGSPPAVCAAVLRGQRKPGDTCNMVSEFALMSECEIGAACIPSPTGCTGTCVRRGILGEACSIDRPCIHGETCNLGTGRCTPIGGPGTACGFASILRCEPGLFCSDALDGTCKPYFAIGAACDELSVCMPPAACDLRLEGSRTCKVPLRPGNACTPLGFQCATGLSYCGSDNMCHTAAGIGQACGSMDGDGRYCFVGECDVTLAAPVCKLLPVGEVCSTTADCMPGSLCVFGEESLVCSPKCF
jgi:hypothetical protein